MGLFNKLKGKGKTGWYNAKPFDAIPTVYVNEVTTGVAASSESYKVNLSKANEKRVSLVKVNLQKKNVPNLKARIVAVMDDSGSMSGRLSSGLVGRTFERTLPLALELDDNGSIDSYRFTREVTSLPAINMDNIENYARTYFRASGGTDYSVVINAIAKKYGEDEPSSMPTIVLFYTDGNADKVAAADALIRASRYNIFFQFIGLGRDDMSTLEQLDDLPSGEEGRLVDNADFFRIENIDDWTDEAFYEAVMNEFPSWLEAFKNDSRTIKH